ncbi:hypothetical protein LX36DRAFT_714710 [Colletotrichum falcatum]|nr:hypothetical protein LX36DRAFT_714710 [Colletotrichum falcatum]
MKSQLFLALCTLAVTVLGQSCLKSDGGCAGRCRASESDDATVCTVIKYPEGEGSKAVPYPCGISDGTKAGALSKGKQTVCVTMESLCQAFDDYETQCPEFLN